MRSTSTVEILNAKAIAKELRLALKAVARAHSLVMADAPNSIQDANRLAEISHSINSELITYNSID